MALNSIHHSCVRLKFSDMADPLEHATGLEKRELLAIQSGNTDPFDTNISKRGPGTKEQPNVVQSAFDSRIVGCICTSIFFFHKLQKLELITFLIIFYRFRRQLISWLDVVAQGLYQICHKSCIFISPCILDPKWI